MAKLKITWVKSAIGYSVAQKKTLKSLGFKKLNQTVEQDDLPSIRGMINKVDHLVKYEVVK